MLTLRSVFRRSGRSRSMAIIITLSAVIRLLRLLPVLLVFGNSRCNAQMGPLLPSTIVNARKLHTRTSRRRPTCKLDSRRKDPISPIRRDARLGMVRPTTAAAAATCAAEALVAKGSGGDALTPNARPRGCPQLRQSHTKDGVKIAQVSAAFFLSQPRTPGAPRKSDHDQRDTHHCVSASCYPV